MDNTHKPDRITRRTFLDKALTLGVAATAGHSLLAGTAAAGKSPETAAGAAARWVQVDLGASRRIDRVTLSPSGDDPSRPLPGGPIRFRVEASDDPLFATAVPIADHTGADRPNAAGTFPAGGATGRYVRVTVTRSRPAQIMMTMVARMDVWAGEKEASPPRPQGEGVVTDNPGNVIPADQWRPVPYRAHMPLSGVRLKGGVFQAAMENNVGYLLSSFSVDEMLRPFRARAGKPGPTGLRPPIPFWDTDLPGSNAGRFLMGAGNTLRWMEHPELRRAMDAVVEGIAECARPDGYLMAYPEEAIFGSERGAYTRSWVTQGLIEAGYAGHPKAFPLLRGFYDWFNGCRYLPELLRRTPLGVQGMIANSRTYFTPVGEPRDIHVIQRFFQENYWMEDLARRAPRAIWQYPYDRPHSYLITALEPYLDQYRATGAQHYLEAARGGWDLFHDNWEHVGGTIAICEADSYPPKSYYLHRHTGELCGSVFWTRYNQRFHLLDPDQEKYVTEIEKSIYNVGLANQVGAAGIRYHAHLVGQKDGQGVQPNNTCCEGQGTRLLGSLPEYIYSTTGDGIYVNLFAPSAIDWKQERRSLRLTMTTEFPFQPQVHLSVTAAKPTRFAIRVRVPSWASKAMPIHVNGSRTALGRPGAYVTLDRTWKTGDAVTFTLPMEFKTTRYEGAEQVADVERHALEYGPILMAAVGITDPGHEAEIPVRPADLVKSLTPLAGQPLHFAITGDAHHRYLPYWQVGSETFTCYPALGVPDPSVAQGPEPGDLALASLGATASSDSEYVHEPGCTAKLIDGAAVLPGDITHRWHSSLETPHPHWVQVHLPQPARIGRVVIRFSDPLGYPVSFQGIARVAGRDQVLFDVTDCRERYQYRADIAPVLTDTFRFVIRASARRDYPTASQISAVELYPEQQKKQQ